MSGLTLRDLKIHQVLRNFALIFVKGLDTGESFFWSRYVIQGFQTWTSAPFLTSYWNSAANLHAEKYVTAIIMYMYVQSLSFADLCFALAFLSLFPGVQYSWAAGIKLCRHLLLSVSSWGNVNLIWNETMHGRGFYSPRFFASSQKKKCCRACEIHV